MGKLKENFLRRRIQKYIRTNGGNWRQRIGVNWIKALDEPVYYKGSSFQKDIGVIGSPVMGSSTIFKISQEGFNFSKRLIDNSSPNLIMDPHERVYTQAEIIEHIQLYIESQGFYFKKEDIINIFLSIKTKPFVILSGISGTGKTKIVQWFAESVGATEDNGQFTLIPIRPDWNDGSDLLGSRDIKGDFKEGPLTKVIHRASENPTLPHFVLLDERNLARVEYYFSDILSVMESRKWEKGGMVSSLLLTEETAGFDHRIPPNLYIIGTVNMDETTHPLSKKVLDRANTIEFNQVDLGNLLFLEELHTVDPITIQNHQLESKYLHLKDVYHLHKDIVERATAELVRINKALETVHAHVGYRVRDEICFYLAYNAVGELFSFEQAFDYCILQKILPRISGSGARVEKVLKELYTIFTNMSYQPDQDDHSVDIQDTKYPRSAEKVLEMLSVRGRWLHFLLGLVRM